MQNAGWIAAGLAVVVLVVVIATRSGTAGSGGAVPMSAPPPVASGPAPDISSMTPRERADRLFDRIIMANERGVQDTVAFFTPMALDAYRMIGELDPDARYHVGLIHTLAGNLDQVQAQLDSLRQQDPNHLLGFMLEYAAATLQSDNEAATAAYQGFLAAYDAEIARGLTEYEAHRVAIGAFYEDAQASR